MFFTGSTIGEEKLLTFTESRMEQVPAQLPNGSIIKIEVTQTGREDVAFDIRLANRLRQAIATSLQLLHTVQPQDSATRLSVLAQALDTQGNLQLAQGQVEPAITTWQQAESTYR